MKEPLLQHADLPRVESIETAYGGDASFGWGLLELIGHRAGNHWHLQEEERAGTQLTTSSK
jgi:hypothetical protein